MSKRSLQVVVMLLALGISAFAVAEWFGRYYCGECTFEDPFAANDTDMFIRTVVNRDVSSWVDSKGGSSSVTICNGSACATYQYVRLSGVFQYKSKYPSDWNGEGPYVPPSDGSGGSGDGGSAYDPGQPPSGSNPGSAPPPPSGGGGSGSVDVGDVAPF